jgi:TRAP-type C4-dicarboxylate transport system permease small subunit
VGTDQGDGPPKDQPDPDEGKGKDAGEKAKDVEVKEGALDDVPAVAAEPGPAAPVVAEVTNELATAADPPKLRDSMPAIGDDMPLTYPDDGPLSANLRKVDNLVGNVEQAVLFGLLAIVVLTGAFQGLAGKLAGKTWPATYFIVRTGVLAIAMIGAAFASHQQRHLAMDLVSRRLPARGRLVLRVLLAAVTILVAFVLLLSFWRLFNQVAGEHNANDPLPPWLSPFTLLLGAGLIIFHTLLHMVIDIDYFARGKLPPERARSAH